MDEVVKQFLAHLEAELKDKEHALATLKGERDSLRYTLMTFRQMVQQAKKGNASY